MRDLSPTWCKQSRIIGMSAGGERLRRPIHGFASQSDTDDVKSKYSKHQYSGLQKTGTIDKLVDQPDERGLIKNDGGPCGAIVVVAMQQRT